MNYDLIVYDNSCINTIKQYKEYGSRIENLLVRYNNILKSVIDSGVKSGKVNDNLKKFSSEAEKLKKETGELSSKAAQCIDDFLKDMDKADSYLY